MRKIPLLMAACAICLSITAQTNDRKYDFPVKSGTVAWKQFTTHQQMVQATTIPSQMLASFTTRALVETCFDYPLLMDIMAYNFPQKGVEAVSNNFNGLQELMRRPDAVVHLLNKYRQLIATNVKSLPTLVEKGNLVFRISIVELLLSQQQLLANIDKRTAVQLQMAIAQADKFKASNADVFSTTNAVFTPFLSGNLQRHYYKTQFSPAAIEFLNSGTLQNVQTLREINRQ